MNSKKKIFVNASTVLISGGLILAHDIIESLQLNQNFELVFTCPNSKIYMHLQKKDSRMVLVPHLILRKTMRWYLDYLWLPALIKKENPDLVLTLCNLPSITNYKQIFLHINPYVAEKFVRFLPLSINKRLTQWLRSSLTIMRMKYVNLLIVQTEYQKKIVQTKIPQSIPIIIVPPFIPQPKNLQDDFINLTLEETIAQYKILCPARYFEHKNLEILLKVAKLIKKQSLSIKIFLTVSASHGKKAYLFLENIKLMHLEDILVNFGEISHENITELIKKVDAILLPSLLESFSMSCVEAWCFQKPLFVSDLNSIRSACMNAAFYFDPYSGEDIFNTLIDAFKNPDQISRKIKAGKTRLSELPDRNEYSRIIDRIL